MKILVIPNRGRSFNAVRPEAECYISLANAGHKVSIITCTTNAYYNNYKSTENINLIKLKSLKKYSWQVIKQIHQHIKQHNIDIVYATESNGIPNAAFGCIGTNAKMVAYRGTTGGMYKTDPSNYLCTLHPRINGYVGVSNAVTKNIKDKVRASIKAFSRTIYKGHDLSWYQETPVDLTSLAPQLSQSKFNILCIGSPRPYKGMHYMLEAMKELTDLADINLILVGDNFDCDPFTSQINATGMSTHIIQTGFRNDVPQIAASCDVLVLPSEREGLPRVVLESLASGTPVITSANEGAMEIIEHDQNGYIVPIGDGSAIAERIRYLYNHPEENKRLAHGAIETINTKMSHQETVNNMTEFFQSLLTH